MLYSLLLTISSIFFLTITNNLIALIIGLELAIIGLTCAMVEASVLLQEPLGLMISIIFLILAAIDTALGLSILVQYLRMKDESSFEQARKIVKASFDPEKIIEYIIKKIKDLFGIQSEEDQIKEVFKKQLNNLKIQSDLLQNAVDILSILNLITHKIRILFCLYCMKKYFIPIIIRIIIHKI